MNPKKDFKKLSSLMIITFLLVQTSTAKALNVNDQNVIKYDYPATNLVQPDSSLSETTYKVLQTRYTSQSSNTQYAVDTANLTNEDYAKSLLPSRTRLGIDDGQSTIPEIYGINLNNGNLYFNFDPNQYNYDIDVPSYIGNISVNAYYGQNDNIIISRNDVPLTQSYGPADVEISPAAVTKITLKIDNTSGQTNTYTINVHPIELNVSPSVIYAKQNTPVTFTAKKDGAPLSNVQINTAGLSGTTDAKGSCSIDFNMDNNQENIEAFVGNLRFPNVISCLNHGDALIHISGTDKAGNPLSDFEAQVQFSDGNNRRISSDGSDRVNLITSQGPTCNIQLASKNYGNLASYYLKNSDVQINSEINNISLNAAGTVENTLNFNLDGSNAGDGWVAFDHLSIANAYPNADSTASVKHVYAVPGQYSVTASFWNYPGCDTGKKDTLFFDNNVVDLNTSTSAVISLNTAETGTMTLNYTKPVQSNTQDEIIMDGMGLSGDIIRLKAGAHIVDSIREIYDKDTTDGKSHFEYCYYEPWNQDKNDFDKETISVTAGNNTAFTKDLTYNQSIVNADKDFVAPDSNIFCVMCVKTQSGYELREINTDDYQKYNSVNSKLSSGSNAIESFTKDICDNCYHMDSGITPGNYTFSMSRNLGPLYGSDGLTDFIAEASKPLFIGSPTVTAAVNGVSNGIMHVGEACSVAFNVSMNGSPLEGKIVRVNGTPSSPTDADGNTKISLTPDYSGNYFVSIDGFDRGYNYLLSAIDNGQTIAEVDSTIPNLSNFNICVFNSTGWQQNEYTDNDEKIRFIVDPGNYTFELSGTDTSGNAYFLTKNVNVSSTSEISKMEFDANSSDLVKADLNFTYDGNSITPDEVYINKIDGNNSYIEQSIGDAGGNSIKSVYVTKGNYKVYFRGRNSANTLMYLSKGPLSITESKQYNVDLSSSSAGNMSIQITGGIADGRNKSLIIDGQWVYIGSDSSMLLDTGNHKISNVDFQIKDDNNNEYWADFLNLSNDSCVTIDNNSTCTFNEDFNIKDGFKLDLSKTDFSPGENINFRITGANTSGKFTYWGLNPYDNSMTVDILNPSGDKIYSGKMNFTDGNFTIPSDSPLGTYTINVTSDFGPYYGSKTFSEKFNVQSLPNVTADKHFLRSGVENTLTFTVTDSQGAAIANEPVEIRSGGNLENIYYKGTTDANGKYSITFTPLGQQDIYAVVRGHEFWELAFSGESDVELVRASAKDKDGSPLKDFILYARNKDFSWGTTGDGNTENIDTLAKVGSDEVTVIKNFNDATYYMVKSTDILSGLPDDINYVNFDASTSGSVVSQNLSLTYNGGTFKLDDLFIKKSDSISSRFNHVGAYDGTSHIFYVTPGNYDIEAIGTDTNGNRLFLTKYNVSMTSDNANNVINWTSADTDEINLNITGLQSENVKKELSVNNYVFDMSYSSKVIASLGTYTIKPIVSGTFNGKNADYTFSSNTQTTISSTTPLQLNLDLGIQSLKLKVDPSIVSPGDNVNYGMELITNSGYALESISGNNIEYDFTIVKPSGSPEQITSGSFNGNTYKVSPDAANGTYTISAAFDFGSLYGSKSLSSPFTCGKILRGDINGDNKVDSQDTDQLKKILLGKYEGSITDGIKVLSDVDGDGKITSADYAIIKRWLQGKITQLP